MKKDPLVVAALVGWLFVGALAAAPQFVQGPSARYSYAVAYDQLRQVTLVRRVQAQPPSFAPWSPA